MPGMNCCTSPCSCQAWQHGASSDASLPHSPMRHGFFGYIFPSDVIDSSRATLRSQTRLISQAIPSVGHALMEVLHLLHFSHPPRPLLTLGPPVRFVAFTKSPLHLLLNRASSLRRHTVLPDRTCAEFGASFLSQFDKFGTLEVHERPKKKATKMARYLRNRGVSTPRSAANWGSAISALFS